jgi:hypothetical protein
MDEIFMMPVSDLFFDIRNPRLEPIRKVLGFYATSSDR